MLTGDDVGRVVLLVLAAVMLTFSAGWWGSVSQAWRHLATDHPSRGCGRLRHRRWMQLRVLVGLAACGVVAGASISPTLHPIGFLLSWGVVFFLLLWIVVLGLFMMLEARVALMREIHRHRGDEQVIREAVRRVIGKREEN